MNENNSSNMYGVVGARETDYLNEQSQQSHQQHQPPVSPKFSPQQQQQQPVPIQPIQQQLFTTSQGQGAFSQPQSSYNFTSSQQQYPSRFDNIDIDNDGLPVTPFERVTEFVTVSNKAYQNFLDSTTPHVGPRWVVFGLLLLVFMLRIVACQGFYVIAYALGIYLLNIFLLFLSPKFDPAYVEDEGDLDNDAMLDDDLSLPLDGPSNRPNQNEFRPFIRRLPEFKFWHAAVTSTAIGLTCTLFPFLDIPVFWPILLAYFVLLFALTMRRQIQHMIKYKYLPFDLGKKAYA